MLAKIFGPQRGRDKGRGEKIMSKEVLEEFVHTKSPKTKTGGEGARGSVNFLGPEEKKGPLAHGQQGGVQNKRNQGRKISKYFNSCPVSKNSMVSKTIENEMPSRIQL